MVTQLIRRLLVCFLVILPTAAHAGFPSGSFHRPHPQVIFNAITLGATCNGSFATNDDPAFFNAGNTMRADPRVIAGADVVLYVPPGSSCIFGSCSGSYWHGLNNFTLITTGATMTSSGGCLKIISGGIDFTNVGGEGAAGQAEQKLQTVSAGATCVTTVTASDAGMYTPGRWSIIAGIGLQGSGFPPNFGTFEYVKIASANSSTGQVCFTTSLINSYKSTWINNGPNGCSGIACGGPARLYNMNSTWGVTTTVVGGTWAWDKILEFVTQNVVMNNVTYSGLGHNSDSCFAPSFNQTTTFNNSTLQNCKVEVDKENVLWTINGGSADHLLVQSSSMQTMTYNNTSVANNDGAAANTICNNSTITSINFGNSFGNPLSFAGTNCNITNNVGINFNNPGSCDGTGCTGATLMVYNGSGNFQVQATNSYSDGAPPQWYTPGTRMLFGSATSPLLGFPFTVTDNSCSGGSSSTCFGGTATVATNSALSSPLSSSLPPIDSNTGTGHALHPDPMHNWSCSGCTGGPMAIDLSQAGAQNAPLFTYTNRTFTCTANLPNVPGAFDINSPVGGPPGGPIVGNWTSLTFNVSTADTNPGNATLTFQSNFIRTVDQVTGSEGFFLELVNLKTAGTRTITTSAITGSQTGDNLTQPSTNAFVAGDGTISNWQVSANLSSESAAQCPVVTVTWQATR